MAVNWNDFEVIEAPEEEGIDTDWSQFEVVAQEAAADNEQVTAAANEDDRYRSDEIGMKAYEPSLMEKVGELFSGPNKDRAYVEIKARQIADEEGISVDDVYKSAGSLNRETPLGISSGANSGRSWTDPKGSGLINAFSEGATAADFNAEAEKKKAVLEGADENYDKNVIERAIPAASAGWDSMTDSLSTTKYILSGGDTGPAAETIANSLLRGGALAKTQTTGERGINATAGTESNGLYEGLGVGIETAKEFFSNPGDAAVFTAGQLPNSAPAYGLGAAGAAAGSVAGPGGAIVGGRSGLALGTAAVEVGAEVQQAVSEQLEAQGLPPTKANVQKILESKGFIGEARERALKKGLTVAAVDQLFLTVGGKVASAPVIKAKNTAFETAYKGALRTGKDAEAAKAIALDAAKSATAGKLAKAKSGVAGIGLDAAGETTGEVASQMVARGEVDAGDAALEGLAGFPSSAVDVGIGSTIEMAKRGYLGGKKDTPQSPPNTPDFTPTHKAGGGIEVTQVVKNGQPVPDTYADSTGKVVRDANAVPIEPVDSPIDTSVPSEFNEGPLDANAQADAIKAEVFNKGIVGSVAGIPADMQAPGGDQSAREAALARLEEVSRRNEIAQKELDQQITETGAPMGQQSVMPEANIEPVSNEMQQEVTGIEPVNVNRETVQPESAELAAIEPAAARPEITAKRGKSAEVVTSAGANVNTEYAVIESDQPIASNDDVGNKNPLYPEELQPRDRSRGASQLQVAKIANNIKPELLGESIKASDGAPVIGRDGVVESGNGRMLAIRRAYKGEKAAEYRNYLLDNAERFGLDKADIAAMNSPALVRIRADDADMKTRAQFAREANIPDVAPLSPMEQATSDADLITDADIANYSPSKDGDVLAASNSQFLQGFAKKIGDLASGGLSTSDGRWTKQMADRIQAAVFQKAYNDERLLSLMAEEADGDIKNIINALNVSAPAFARAKSYGELGPLNVISDIVAATDVIRQAKADKTSVEQIISQSDMFGEMEPVVAVVAQFIEDNKRAPKRMGIAFTEMAKFIENEMQNQSQDGLFESAPVNKADIINAAKKQLKEVYGDETTFQDLFAEEQDQQGGSNRNAEPGRSGGQQSQSTGTETKTEAAPEVNKELEGAERKERRNNNKARELYSQMSKDEMLDTILSHELTGIKGRRAFVVEVQDAPFIVSIDADSLKWVNDELSPDHGDALLQAVADAILGEVGADAYHVSGDEFYILADTTEHAEAVIKRAEERLKQAVITANKTDGKEITLNGLNITYGIGETKDAADSKLKQEKAAKEQAGERAARGEQPPQAVVKPAEGQQADRDAATKEELKQVEAILEAAGVTGEAFINAVEKFNDGKLTLETLKKAYPAKVETEAKSKPDQETVTEKADEKTTSSQNPGKEALESSLKKRGIEGDKLLDALDLADDLIEKGGVISNDGIVTLYHRTTPDGASAILSNQEMTSKEDSLFFGTSPTGQIEGYGDSVVKVLLPLEKLELNDVFSNEAHVTMKSGRIGTKIPVSAFMVEAKTSTGDGFQQGVNEAQLDRLYQEKDTTFTIEEPKAGQLDMFTTPEVDQAETAKKVRVKTLRKVSEVRTGMFYSGVEVVDSLEKAAHVIAPLRKYPVEQFIVLVLDKDKRPISILRHTIGTGDGANVYPKDVIGALHATPGAKYFYLAHNHPSGQTQPSRADRAITEKILSVTDKTGVTSLGHIITGPGGSMTAFEGDLDMEIKPALLARNKVEIPVTEGKITLYRKPTGSLTSPTQTQIYVRENLIDDAGQVMDGILWLDNRNQVLGFTPMSQSDMDNLTGQNGLNAGKLYKNMRTHGAMNMIVTLSKRNDMAIQNMNRFANAAEIPLLDTLNHVSESGAELESGAENGILGRFGDADFHSKAPVSTSAAKTWLEIAKNDEIFSYPRSEATDFAAIMGEVSTGMMVEPVTGRIPKDVVSAWEVRPVNGGGYGTVIEYDNGTVQVSLKHFKQGENGSAIYAATGNYAYNNGLAFAADKLGVGPTGNIRRIENLISLALKFQTTDFIQPFGKNAGKWVKGDTANNLQFMLEESYENTLEKHPDIENYEFDPSTNQIKPRPVQGRGVDRAEQGGEARDSSDGKRNRSLLSRTKRRAIITRNLLRRGGIAGAEDVLLANDATGDMVQVQYSTGRGEVSPVSTVARGNKKPAKSIPIEALEKIVSNLVKNHKGMKGLTFHIRPTQDGAFGQGSVERDGVIKGGFYANTNEIVLIAENIKNAADALAVIRHEVVGHFGLRQLLNKEGEFDALLARVYAGRNDELKDLYGWVISAYPDLARNNDIHKIADEMLARAAEVKKEGGLLTKIIDELIRLMQKFGLMGKVASQREVDALLRASAKNLRNKEAVNAREAYLDGAEAVQSKQGGMFYSQMQAVLADKLPGKGTGISYRNTIAAWAKKGEFKQEEYEWSGVDEWLQENALKKLTKQDVLDFVAANQIEVQEVEKGGEAVRQLEALKEERGDFIRNYANKAEREGYDKSGAENALNTLISSPFDQSAWGVIQEHDFNQTEEFDPNYMHDIRDQIESVSRDVENGANNDSTKFFQYVTPGGESYRELLLTLPATKEQRKKVHDRYGADMNLETMNPQSRADTLKAVGANPGFLSSHYDEPNILAHVRYNERTDAEGKKVLFVDEIQSDWHQEGRKKGYGPQVEDGWVVRAKDGHGIFRKFSLNEESAARKLASEHPELEAVRGEKVINKPGGVPDAPFKTTWPLLAFKRMIRMAAEGGFDSIAWTTGEMQADRYDMSKQVDSIRVGKNSNGRTYYVQAHKNGEQVVNEGGIAKEKLAEMIGKELADRAIADTEQNSDNQVVYSGVDLKVGGEGMKGFYDDILPKSVNKYVKKWGAKVGEANVMTGFGDNLFATHINSNGEEVTGGQSFTEVHSLPITDKMRDAALQGQPLFSKSTNNTGEFNPQSPNILFSRVANKPVGGNLGMPDETFVQLFVRKFQDNFNRIQKLQTVIEESGGTVDNESNVYLAEELSSDKIATRLGKLDKQDMKPLVSQMDKDRVSLEVLDTHLIMKHAKERNDYIADINSDMPDGGSGVTNMEAADYFQALDPERAKVLDALADRIYKVNREALDVLIESGQLTQETVDEWAGRWEYYVPLKGKEGEENRSITGTGYSIRGAGIQSAMGRGAGNLAESPVAHVFAQAESAIVRAEKNTIGLAFADLVRKNPDPSLWTINQRTLETLIDEHGEPFIGYEEAPADMVEGFDFHRVMTVSKAERDAAKLEGRKPVKKVAYKIDPNFKQRDDVFVTMENGNELVIRIKDPLVAEQMKRMNTAQLNAIFAGFAQVNRYRAIINTGLNPEFVVTNFERDIQLALAKTGIDFDIGTAKDVAKAVPGAMRGIFQSTFDTKGTSKWRAVYEEMREAGGGIGFFGLEDTHTRIKHIQHGLDRKRGVWGMTKRGSAKVRDLVLDANLSVENAARVAVYKVVKDRLIANGMSEKEAKDIAASAAKNISVNFNRKGEYGPALNAMYLFSGAAIQGIALVLKLLKSKRGRRVAGTLAVMGFMQALYNRGAGDDDDEIPYWDKISEYTKQTNWIIVSPHGDNSIPGSKGRYFKIRMPYGLNVFPYTGGAIHDLIYDDKKTAGGTTLNMLSAVLNAYMPIQGADLLDTITPEILKPIEQSSRNINFMMSPIKPENPYARYDVPESQKAWKSTSEELKATMEWLNEISGGDETHAGIIDISPETVKHYAGWLTGGAGLFVTRSVGVGVDLVTGKEIESKNVPFLRTAVGNVGSYYDSDRFYEAMKQVEAVKAQSKLYKGTDRYGEYRQENRELIRLSHHTTRYRNKIAGIRDKRDKAYKDKNDELAKEYSEQMRQEMMEFSSRYYNALEQQE